ncbi:unnamed protein product [Zymoseptoria tritici ST99CH_1E4]|uniref:Zn(2)-C6 fungal-type domain-containing protein n=1 Tax=Zymoseptoria tritici ST99CH_1E4 TaxID=1276532 RepID=A0A2H1FM42_ZYMTR|nr:unnamed protein product [Zymoseptoria tritici ST99CH_1E4]
MYGGSSQSGSDIKGFDVSQELNVSENTGTAGYRAGLDTMQQGFMGGFDISDAVGQDQDLDPLSALFEESTRTSGQVHRRSTSGGGALGSFGRQNSLGTSDTNSPGQRGTDQNQADQTGGEEGQDGFAPAWSELKTKAGKERKRLPLACIACRRKKIRCSGEKPACKHCLRSRIPCVYKVTTRKAAPRTDYMAMLDKRLKRMEDRVIKVLPKEDLGVVTNTGRAVVKPALPPPPPKSAGPSKKRAAEQAFGDELNEWAAGQSSSNTTKTAAAPAAGSTTKTRDEEHNLLLEGADKLPSKEIQEHLAEVFFDYVYGQSYHLLHKPSFMRKLAQGSVPPVLALAVCAISARFSNHPAVRTEPAFLRGESWASAARDIALRRYDTPNITILIVYLILGLHEFGTCQGGRSWMFGGMAQRMAYALQLHMDLDHDPKNRAQSGSNALTFTDREIRRRTMWSCFLMDRFNSSGTDRPIFVGEQYIRAQLPVKESYYQMDITGLTEDLEGNVPNSVEPGTGQTADAKENMGVAAYLIRLVSIWGKLINYLNLGGKERDQHPMWSAESQFSAIKRAVETWKDSLPPSLLNTPGNLQNHASEKIANQYLFLHIVYNQILLFMNRFALPIPGARQPLPKDIPDAFVAEASRTAFDAANQISALIRDATDHLVVAPFAGYCAFFSSTVHIHGAFSKNAALEASSKQNLAHNVKYLTKMKKYWGMFHFVTENLRDLYRRHADAARSGGTKTGRDGGGEHAIFQYGDWFDRYPHGVSGTDYEEPATADVKKESGSDAVLGQKSNLQTVEEFFSKLSPPSRVAQTQAAAAASKKVAKKRAQSKSEGTAGKSGLSSQAQQAQAGAVTTNNDSSEVTHDLAATQAYQHNLDNPFQHHQHQRHHSSAFPPGFQPPHNDLIMSPPHLMSQLDRQMVLNSYAAAGGVNPGLDQAALTSMLMDPTSTANNVDQSTAGLESFDFNPFANSTSNTMAPSQAANNANTGFWGDPSTAWFMPFNLDPPLPQGGVGGGGGAGSDMGFFGGNDIDWSAGFGSFGDFSAELGGTGLTPGGPQGTGVDVDMELNLGEGGGQS